MGLRVGGAPAYAHIRRAFERGEPLTPWHIGVLTQANTAALDALARVVGDSLPFVWLPGVEEGETRRMMGRALASVPPCGQAGTSRWCPHPLGHGGPCTVDWAVVEGPERRNLSEAEFNEEGMAFAPTITVRGGVTAAEVTAALCASYPTWLATVGRMGGAE